MGWICSMFAIATFVLICRLTIAGREIDQLRRALDRREVEHLAEVRHLARPIYHLNAINRRFSLTDFGGRGDDRLN